MANTENVLTVLPPYHDEASWKKRKITRLGLYSALLFFCFVYGFAFAFLAPYLMMIFAVPLAIVFGLIIWALPDVERPPLGLMNFLFFGFTVTMFIWPNYLALALPGLPWITVARLFSVPLAITLLICLSVSQAFRAELMSILSAAPIIPISLGLFVLAQAISLGFSNLLSFSMSRFLINQVQWTTMFFVSCFLFAKAGRAERWAWLMWGLALYLCMLGLVEAKLGHVPWQGHVPSFLKIDDASLVDSVAAGGKRIGTGAHRVATIFTTPLTFSEFLALVAPIVLYFAVTERALWIRAAALATIPLLTVVTLLTQSRSGVLGIGIASLLALLAWALLRLRQGGSRLFPAAVATAYPAVFGAMLAASIFIGKLRRAVWGGGEHAGSNAARVQQYQRGIPMVISHPFGHGIARGAEALGFYLPSGLLTIDTLYLEVALDYGIFGFIVYYLMIYSGIFYSARYGLRPSLQREYALLISCCLMLVNFAVINTVFAEKDNHSMIFIALGLVTALIYRSRIEEKTAPPPAETTSGRPLEETVPVRRPSSRPLAPVSVP